MKEIDFTKEIPPKDLDEAVHILKKYLDEGDKDSIAKVSENEFLGSVHFSYGMVIRNSWHLWDEEGKLHKWFCANGIFHADDMSGLILLKLYRNVSRKQFDLEKESIRYWIHWIKHDRHNLGEKTLKYLFARYL